MMYVVAGRQHTDRQTDTLTDTHTLTDINTQTYIHTHTDRQTDRWTQTQSGVYMYIYRINQIKQIWQCSV